MIFVVYTVYKVIPSKSSRFPHHDDVLQQEILKRHSKMHLTELERNSDFDDPTRSHGGLCLVSNFTCLGLAGIVASKPTDLSILFLGG